MVSSEPPPSPEAPVAEELPDIVPSEPRYPLRRERKKNVHQDYVYNISVKRAMKEMPEQAHASMHDELAQLHNKGVWSPVPPSFHSLKKLIKSFLFLKQKTSSTGEFLKLKSRLVAGGHLQDTSDLLYEDVHSPTAYLPHVMMVAALAARDNRHVKTIDITGAYLNADTSSHGVLMEIDATNAKILAEINPNYRKFIRSNGSMVVELKKALYGCVESAKLWFDLLTSTLKADGYVQNPKDPCVYYKMVDGQQVTVVIYVDDY
jgi:hypothetical protein